MRALLVAIAILACPALAAGGTPAPTPLHHATRQKGPDCMNGVPVVQGQAAGPLHQLTREKGPGAVAPVSRFGRTTDPNRPGHRSTREKGPTAQASKQA